MTNAISEVIKISFFIMETRQLSCVQVEEFCQVPYPLKKIPLELNFLLLAECLLYVSFSLIEYLKQQTS